MRTIKQACRPRPRAFDSLTWLRAELSDYWPQREALAAILRYLAAIDGDHWREDAAVVENDHV